MEKRIDSLETKLKSVESGLAGMRDDLKNILFYLHNDERTGEKGLVAEVRDLKLMMQAAITTEKTSEALRNQKAKFWGAVAGFITTGILSVIGYGFTVVVEWYKNKINRGQ